ncbi:WXG100 family type VII secretion target [Nocardioides ferulae]|uniref:WXG100 family type VII secretion target n=1 Tax=Nocardioides ferulae TaxID=2340821 RepID=UPI000EB53740|nr:hypothetical protein [Nocardioides ferulae]
MTEGPVPIGGWLLDFGSEPAATASATTDGGSGGATSSEGAGAGGQVLSTVVSGDPADCRRTAAELHHTAARLDAIAAILSAAVRVPGDEFGGQAGDAFRARAHALAANAGGARDRAQSLARGLTALADGLETANATMRRARSAALPVLVVGPDAVVGPTAGEPPAHWDAWRLVRATVGRARAAETDAQQAWQAVLSATAASSPPGGHPTADAAGGPRPHGPDATPGTPQSASPPVVSSGPTGGLAPGPTAGPATTPDGTPTGCPADDVSAATVTTTVTAIPVTGSPGLLGILIDPVPPGAVDPQPAAEPASPIDRCPDPLDLIEGVRHAR